MSTTLPRSITKPPVDFDQEVRFAVVMYGGSSLAIYINGVAQELLRLVRATAPEFSETPNPPRQVHLADEELRGSERVYRRLGRLLRRQGMQADETSDNGNRGPIRTRFVVDILTGTSAGGINAVYLAKALANDQDMDELQTLWVKEGDIDALLNDEESYTDDLGFKLDDEGYPGEPWSLLNSRRMHRRLLEALRGMETTREQKQGERICQNGESPLVDELDLFVTATDMAGLVLKLRLADKVATEYRFRNIFRFRYRGKRATAIETETDTDKALNELEPRNNAFLAFAARATSAHQAAFSPVKFDDSTHVVGKIVPTDERPADHRDLRVFYQDYLLQRAGENNGALADPEKLAADFRKTWFVDGGTLDNKPFSFVIQQLPMRHAENFVDRKLLYVEPSPEHLKRVEELNTERPRIKENALKALSSLPRYETIVEDLTRLLERNRLVQRLRHIMLGEEADLIYGLNPKQKRTRGELRNVAANRDEFMEWLREKGPGWGSYQRLRVAEVTDDMTLLVARAAGFSEESDEFLAIRHLVRDWRDRNYDAHMDPDPETKKARKAQLQFLIDFDLPWAMRRVRFCLNKLNDLACLDEPAKKLVEVADRDLEVADRDLMDQWPERESEKQEFREALREMRQELNEALLILRSGRRKFWLRDYEKNPFRPDIAALELTSAHLLKLLRLPTDAARNKHARQLLSEKLTDPARTRNDAVEALTDKVREELAKVIDKARGKCSKAMNPEKVTAETSRWELFLRKTLFYYYKYFEDFDQISYPILYSTAVGEEIDEIDVFRVSPEDATAIIDESKKMDETGKEDESQSGKKIQKLAGTTLANFGAFLRDKFRTNDILWGRLDGAERVIAALLPADKTLRDQMTERAHRAIIVENRLFADDDAAGDRALQRMIWDALDAWDDLPRREKLLGDAAQRLPPNSAFRLYIEELKRDAKAEPIDLFRDDFFKNYKESRRLEENRSIKSIKRARGVLSGMALSYFPEKDGGSKLRHFLMFLGERLRIFIEAALDPEGQARTVQRRNLGIAYVVSLLILVLLCLPVILKMRATQWPWPGVFFLVIFFLTLAFALQPLALTGVYHLAWLKLRGKVEALLLRFRES